MPEDYVIKPGDSVLSVASARGFLWKTIWNDGGNASLKDKRKDPDILLPGDVLHIPDKQKKSEDKPTDAQHKFTVKHDTAKFKVTILRQPKDSHAKQTEQEAKDAWRYLEEAREPVKPEPMDFVPYELWADGKLVDKGSTTKDGKIDAKVSATAGAGLLYLNKGKPEERIIELNFRQMHPLSEFSGVGRRLYNMGFPCSTDATELTTDLKQAIAAFQKREGLQQTGDADDGTRNKIKDAYGG